MIFELLFFFQAKNDMKFVPTTFVSTKEVTLMNCHKDYNAKQQHVIRPPIRRLKATFPNVLCVTRVNMLWFLRHKTNQPIHIVR